MTQEKCSDDTQQPKPEDEPYNSLMKALQAKDVPLVKVALEKHDTITTNVPLHAAAFDAGVEIYGLFLDKFPHLIEYTFGHSGDPVGEAVADDDLPMLEMLLKRGVNLKYSHHSYFPVLAYARMEGNQKMVDLLEQHGAPEVDEEEGEKDEDE